MVRLWLSERKDLVDRPDLADCFGKALAPTHDFASLCEDDGWQEDYVRGHFLASRFFFPG